jgi:hypothetical protein
LVSHQSFPHLWKKLWKSGEIGAGARFEGRVYTEFSRGESRKPFVNLGCARKEAREAPENRLVSEAKLHRESFFRSK